MKKSGLPLIFWLLAGVLVIAAVLSIAPTADPEWKPLGDSRDPAGTAAFAELLRRSGYEVVIDRTSKPTLRKGDIVLVFSAYRATAEFGPESSREESRTYVNLDNQIADFVKGGGKCLWLTFEVPMRTSIRSAALGAYKVTSTYGPKRERTVSLVRESYEVEESSAEKHDYDLELWKTRFSMLVELSGYGSGVYCAVYDAIGITNNLIGQHDNARFFIDLVRMLSPNNGRVVMAHATMGDVDDPSILQALGPWALATQWQIVGLLFFLFIIVSKRFGLPQKNYAVERGDRDLVDAFSGMMGRSRRSRLAVRLLRQDIEHRIRVRLGANSNLQRAELLKQVSVDLQSAIASAEMFESEKKPARGQGLFVSKRLVDASDKWFASRRS